MQFDWDEEQLAYRDLLAEFARRELDGDLPQRDRGQVFPAEAWRKCAAVGVQGLPVPVDYGGSGAPATTIALALETLGHACRDAGLLFSLNAQMWACETPIVRFGSEEQRQAYLPRLCDGSLIAAHGMSEADSGSDAFALSTTARPTRDGSGYVLNGAKVWTTNAPVAGLFVVFATTDRAKGLSGLTAFLVERETPGLEVLGPVEKMGLRTSPMGELVLTDCEVPASARLGSEGAGMAIFNSSMEWERGFILASGLGAARRQLEQAVAYAKQRRQFGQPIASFQAISHRLVDMRVRLDAARSLLYDLAWRKQQGRGAAVESAVVKLFCSEAIVQCALDAQTIYGAAGYTCDLDLEREVRDALASRVYSGTSDIQRNLIAQRMGL
ncbi:MAG TPA: acyl-CoA dehydrogenase family protein [Acidimicrobiales bacterium]|nr:acyl-CoA dehydrogenase family protein [Acidimicrobiales bacterium]